MPSRVQDEMTFLFPNLNGCTFEIWKWISNFIPHLIMHVIFMLGLKLNHVWKKGHCSLNKDQISPSLATVCGFIIEHYDIPWNKKRKKFKFAMQTLEEARMQWLVKWMRIDIPCLSCMYVRMYLYIHIYPLIICWLHFCSSASVPLLSCSGCIILIDKLQAQKALPVSNYNNQFQTFGWCKFSWHR